MKNKDDRFGFMQVYAKYFNLTFQMIAIIVLGGFGGKAIDTWLRNEKGFFVVICIVLATILSLYLFFKTILKK